MIVQTSLIQNFRYRPEIDGLRAVAVVTVVLFHARILFAGGFVGVDVFFVISGYLITSLIIRDLEQGTFTLTGFWERRARRILPAVCAVVFATLIAGGFLLLPADYLRLGKSVISQSFFAANIYYFRNTGYFAAGTEQLPLLQTWSLAVEEQFYWIVPLLLLGLFRFPALRRRRMLVLVLVIGGAVASFSAGVHALATQPAKAFYLLPGRAWELLLGAIVAIGPAAFLASKPKMRECACWLGLTAIGVSCLAYSSRTPFPGLAALLPCLGAALIIWSNDSMTMSGTPPTWLGRLMATRPLVFIGSVSYSFYLWHWPLFAFSRYWALNPLSLGFRWTIVATSFVLAVLSLRFIETPFRRKQVCKTRKSIFALSGVSLAILFTAGLGVLVSGGVPQRLPAKAAVLADGENDAPVVDDVTTDMIISGAISKFGARTNDGAVDVLLWGDSHAQHFLPALEEACREKNLTGQIISYTSTMPLVGWSQRSRYGLNEESERWCVAVVDHVKRAKIRNVIVAARWEDLERFQPQEFTEALERTISALRAAGARVYVMMQVPSHNASIPKVLVYSYLAHKATDEWQSTWQEHTQKHKVMYGIKNNSKEYGSALVDPAPGFKPASGDRLLIEANGRPLYRDTHHLTTYGSKLVITPLLEEMLETGAIEAATGRSKGTDQN